MYTDNLICSNGAVTATGMASVLGKSHDWVSQSLRGGIFDSKYLWQQAKPFIESIEQQQAAAGTVNREPVMLCFDDSVEEKPYSDESELICWHYDHTLGRAVKGVNFLSALVVACGVRIPCAVEFVLKDRLETDAQTGKQKRVASCSKNEQFRQMVAGCHSRFSFDYVLADTWYSSVENMAFVVGLRVQFIMALKSNRKVALSREEKKAKQYVSIESLQPGQRTVEVWLKELDFPLLLTKQVFKNGDGTVGELYLACSDLSLTYEQINMYYQKRWRIEEYHKSLKSNLGFARSPTKIIRTQLNHFMLTVVAYLKLETLRLKTNLNHFALKARIYLAAQRAAHNELQQIQQIALKDPLTFPCA